MISHAALHWVLIFYSYDWWLTTSPGLHLRLPLPMVGAVQPPPRFFFGSRWMIRPLNEMIEIDELFPMEGLSCWNFDLSDMICCWISPYIPIEWQGSSPPPSLVPGYQSSSDLGAGTQERRLCSLSEAKAYCAVVGVGNGQMAGEANGWIWLDGWTNGWLILVG